MCLTKPRMTGIAIVLLLSITACRRSTETMIDKEPTKESTPGGSVEPTDARPAKVDEPPPKPTMPEVKLTEAMEATCLVKVGDTMPDGNLADPESRLVESKSMLGSKLTVLCFWTGDSISALQELDELQKYVVEPYEEKGVRVFGINEKNSPQTVGQKLDLAGAKFTNYRDPDGAFLAKFATEGLPRTYLLDSTGKVLWFDTQYSQGTKRDLLQAINFLLTQ